MSVIHAAFRLLCASSLATVRTLLRSVVAGTLIRDCRHMQLSVFSYYGTMVIFDLCYGVIRRIYGSTCVKPFPLHVFFSLIRGNPGVSGSPM